MNEQLIRFIELCLVDGVITDKEREVIFRKSNELGVLEDECEIILEGMIFKYNKENNIQNVAVSDKKNESNVEVEIVLKVPVESEVDEDFLRGLFFSEREKQIPLVEKRISTINKNGQLLLEKRENVESEFRDLLKRKSILSMDSSQVEMESLEFDIYQNDQNLIRIKNEIDLLQKEVRDLEREKENISNTYSEFNFGLFLLLYKKSTLLYQSPIFDKLLQEVNINNDKQILNLTRLLKFLVEKEKNYGRQLGRCFKMLEGGSLSKKDIELILFEKKVIISFSNSFHLMFTSLTKNQMGVYMKIYLELESIGMFNTYFEKEVLKNLNQISQQLNKLNDTLLKVSKEISQTNNYLQLLNAQMYNVNLNLDRTNSKLDSLDYSLGDISYSIQEGNRNLEMSVDLLKDLKGGIGLNNLLTGIQAYQLYKINRNTKVLR